MCVRSTAARLMGVGATLWLATTTLVVATPAPAEHGMRNMLAYENPAGHHRTFNVNGTIDLKNIFFASVGTNGRACSSCHQPSDGWSVTPEHIRDRFDASGGEDPIFRTNDGSSAPGADVSTEPARRDAYNMLLSKGLIRVGLGVPADAEFELIAVDDPYGYASAAELSLFRRPLPTTNLAFLSDVMWDGRETLAGQTMHFNLRDQANAATVGHAAASRPLTDAQRREIVQFELGLFTAQSDDREAGDLRAHGVTGGPAELVSLPFFIGINDVLGPSFDPRAFTLFDAWTDLRPSPRRSPAPPPYIGVRDHGPDHSVDDGYVEARRAIARGQEIFNTRPIAITGVKGVNDVLGVETLPGTCSTCHNTPNVGSHSTSLPIDLGIASEARRTPDLPLYTFRNTTTGEIVKTSDPGRALITGKWQDMSQFKAPVLRALASRPPYFHNGSAATLEGVVTFYGFRFKLQLTAQEKADLVAFLRAL